MNMSVDTPNANIENKSMPEERLDQKLFYDLSEGKLREDEVSISKEEIAEYIKQIILNAQKTLDQENEMSQQKFTKLKNIETLIKKSNLKKNSLSDIDKNIIKIDELKLKNSNVKFKEIENENENKEANKAPKTKNIRFSEDLTATIHDKLNLDLNRDSEKFLTPKKSLSFSMDSPVEIINETANDNTKLKPKAKVFLKTPEFDSIKDLPTISENEQLNDFNVAKKEEEKNETEQEEEKEEDEDEEELKPHELLASLKQSSSSNSFKDRLGQKFQQAKESGCCVICCLKDDNENDEANKKKPNICKRWRISFTNSKYSNLRFYRNNLSLILCVLVFIIIHIILAVIQLSIYNQVNDKAKTARVCGIWLNFECSIIMFFVMRRMVSLIRNSFIGSYLPCDNFIQFHKYIGVLIFVFSFIHTLAHCINSYYLSNEHQSYLKAAGLPNKFIGSYAELLFTTKLGIGWILNTAPPTGWVCLAILVIIVTFSIPPVRKKGYFQLFYITHWTHPLFFIFLFIHAGNFWKWFIGPLFFVIIERAYNFYRERSKNYGNTFIRDVNLLTSKVTHLVIPRPQNFKFHSGDYLFIKIPKIAKNEWHPFTISSAPEKSDEIWLHIRSLGNWTNKLYDHFLEISTKGKSRKKSIFVKAAPPTDPIPTERRMSRLVVLKSENIINSDSKNKSKKSNKVSDKASKKVIKEDNLNISSFIKNVLVDVSIDGPYSTSSRRIMESEQAILIAGGIGVTPFASILQSLWFKYSRALKTCSKCKNQWYDLEEQKKLKRVDFIWVNRDYQAFEWFIELLGELELQQLNSKRFINIHLFMTSAKEVQEIKPLERPDFDTQGQIESRMNDFSLKLMPGRPNIDKIFTDVTSAISGRKVDVFFCGNVEFGNLIQKHCMEHKFKFYKEYF